jgi:hypothetical protein
MARHGIGGLYQAQLQRQRLVFPKFQGGECEAFTGAQTDMQGFEPSRLPQFQGPPKRDR